MTICFLFLAVSFQQKGTTKKANAKRLFITFQMAILPLFFCFMVAYFFLFPSTKPKKKKCMPFSHKKKLFAMVMLGTIKWKYSLLFLSFELMWFHQLPNHLKLVHVELNDRERETEFLFLCAILQKSEEEFRAFGLHLPEGKNTWCRRRTTFMDEL